MSTSFRRSSKAYFRRRSDNDRDMLYIFLWSFFSGRDSCISVFIVFCIFVSLEVCISVALGSVLVNSPLGLPFFTWFFPLSPSPIASLRPFQKFGSKGRIIFCAVTASLVAEHILPITGGFRKAHIITNAGREQRVSPFVREGSGHIFVECLSGIKNVKTSPRIARSGLRSRTSSAVCLMSASPARA